MQSARTAFRWRPASSSAFRQSPRRFASTVLPVGPASHVFKLGVGAGVAMTVGGLAAYLVSRPGLALDSSAQLPVKQRRRQRTISAEEVSKHRTKDSMWVVIDDKVWDITGLYEMHVSGELLGEQGKCVLTVFSRLQPGGQKVLDANGGKDVTKIFKTVHPTGTLEKFLTDDQLMGYIDVDDVQKIGGGKNQEDLRLEQARKELRNVDTIVSIDEFEEVCQKILSEMALSYYSTGFHPDTRELMAHPLPAALRDERDSWQRVRFRPRILRKMRHIDSRTTFTGLETPYPFYIAPAGLAKLGHPDGETGIVRGAAPHDILQIVSSGASLAIDEIFAAKEPNQNLAWQFYKHSNPKTAEEKLNTAMKLGAKSIWLTVDVPVLGKRERDLKLKARSQSYEHPISAQFKAAGSPDPSAKEEKTKGTSDIADTAHIDADLNWDHIAWIRERAPGVPIIIKGVGTVEDVELAHQYGADGVVLSTHGARQLDGARAPLDVLIEIRRRNPALLKKLDVFIDGGARRGTDVVKALCLGAKGVGFGRPFLYANSAYGPEGVSKAITILQDEIHMAMRLLGANTIADLKPDMVEVSAPERWVPIE
ncbi:hypothetical protein JCM11251_005058 [Rhodosporidiobolus azoricus]